MAHKIEKEKETKRVENNIIGFIHTRIRISIKCIVSKFANSVLMLLLFGQNISAFTSSLPTYITGEYIVSMGVTHKI